MNFGILERHDRRLHCIKFCVNKSYYLNSKMSSNKNQLHWLVVSKIQKLSFRVGFCSLFDLVLTSFHHNRSKQYELLKKNLYIL